MKLHARLSAWVHRLQNIITSYYEYQRSNSYRAPYDHDGLLLHVKLKVDLVKHVSLKRFNAVDALGKVGALFTSMVLIGKVMVNIISFRKFDFELIKNLFKFEKGVFDKNEDKQDKVGLEKPFLEDDDFSKSTTNILE